LAFASANSIIEEVQELTNKNSNIEEEKENIMKVF
jgi:hypothetical protein